MNKCEICLRPRRDWPEETLDDHVRHSHADSPASVKAIYPKFYEQYFADSPPAGEPDGPEEPDDLLEDPRPPDVATGKKWYLIGVGGAGNNIMDAILLRRDTLSRNNEERAQIWQGGLAGYGVLDTNIIQLEESYYAREEKGFGRQPLIQNAIIGNGVHDYTGMGRRWDKGKEVMEADFADGGNPFVERWDMDPQDIGDAQAVMFVHSVTKGTGCGATPVLARNLREKVLPDAVISKALFSSVVIPSWDATRSAAGGRERTNGVVGLARIAREVDAIIPFDNDCLASVSRDITPRIEGIEEYNPHPYEEINKPLVAFLEAFTMSSTPQRTADSDRLSIRGEVFDVSDSFRPVQDKFPESVPAKETPAVILAPVLGRSRASEIDADTLEILVRNALFKNKLADFDPASSWGATFLVYGPERKMEQVSRLVGDGVLHDLLASEAFLDTANVPSNASVDVHVEQLVIPYLDDVFLWGTLWNPRMPSLEEMYEHARHLKEGNNRQARNLREIWDLVEPLFSYLGRENMV